MSKARFEAFSDGVFAIAITLLILGLAVPALQHPSPAALTNALLRMWPNALAYLLSFGLIGIMWVNHHAISRIATHIDRPSVLINLVLLALAAVVPFVTGVLGAYPTLAPAPFLYGVTCGMTALMYCFLYDHLRRTNAFHPDVPASAIRRTAANYRLAVGLYGGAALIALVQPLAAHVVYWGVLVYYSIPQGVDADLPGIELPLHHPH